MNSNPEWTEYSYPLPAVEGWFAGGDYTSDWVSWKLGLWTVLAAGVNSNAPAVLEVGSWEGRSAVAWLNLLPECRITCIDRWRIPAYEARFDRNTAPFGTRVRKIAAESSIALAALNAEGRSFDLIYIDGEHSRESTLSDSVLAWPLLSDRGIMLWDDYLWETHLPLENRPQQAIDWFIRAHQRDLTIIHRGYQVAGMRRQEAGVMDPEKRRQVVKELAPQANDADAPEASAGSKPANLKPSYWETRKNFVYLQHISALVRFIGRHANSLIDVGTNGCPYLEWFDWIPRRVSVDRDNPYQSATVEGINADFLSLDFQEKFDLCLCLQVLEHIPEVVPFARRLLAISNKVLVSVPYLWPENSEEGHVHDPVDETKVASWFGRAPDFYMLSAELQEHAKSRRLICYYAA
jgi:predicted O-methyltransferase YrrM